MGSPLAPLLSDVCMNWLIDQCQNITTQPLQLYRYVDDIFATYEEQAHIIEFYKHHHSIHPNIQLTYELAQNNQLAFLDVWINNQNGKLTLKTYLKPTHTGLYIKWQSFVPLKYKINLVRNLLHKAYKICSSYSLIHEDFKIISTMLEKNGYPTRFINNQIQKFFNKMHETKKSPEVEDTENKARPKFSILKLPYIGDASHQIEREIWQFLYKKLSQKSKFVMVHEASTIGEKFRYKDRQTALHSSGVMYKLNCSCGQSYIGQSKRNLKTRINDHKPKNSTNNETDVS